MLYHVARISLNRPFLRYIPDQVLSPAPTALDNALHCEAICNTSVDMIGSIIQRFKNQHGLQNAPLCFVHGAISAVDVILTASQRHQGTLSASEETNLSMFDIALGEMSSSWPLAESAHHGIHNILTTRQRGSVECQPSPAESISNVCNLALDSFSEGLNNKPVVDEAVHLGSLLNEGEVSGTSHPGNFDDYPDLWNMLGAMDGGTESWILNVN